VSAPRILLVLLLSLAVVASACGGGGEPSVADYSDAVVLNRNRVDYVLDRITRAQSNDEVLNRMDDAAVVISKAADELDKKGAPKDFQPEADNLVKSLRQLSVDVQATADQARIPGFEDLLKGGVSFNSWDKVNAALAGLAGKGIEVSILQRHGGASG
jgi:hypothetical protein